MNKLNNDYNSRNPEKVKEKKRVLESAKKLSDARKDIIDLFEKGIFPSKGNVYKTKEKEESDEELDEKEFFKYIENQLEGINYELFKNYFNFVASTVLAKELFETNNKNKNSELVNLIKSGLHNLKDKIKEMSKEEKEFEKPDKILEIVEKKPREMV